MQCAHNTVWWQCGSWSGDQLEGHRPYGGLYSLGCWCCLWHSALVANVLQPAWHLAMFGSGTPACDKGRRCMCCGLSCMWC